MRGGFTLLVLALGGLVGSAVASEGWTTDPRGDLEGPAYYTAACTAPSIDIRSVSFVTKVDRLVLMLWVEDLDAGLTCGPVTHAQEWDAYRIRSSDLASGALGLSATATHHPDEVDPGGLQWWWDVQVRVGDTFRVVEEAAFDIVGNTIVWELPLATDAYDLRGVAGTLDVETQQQERIALLVANGMQDRAALPLSL